VITCIVDGDIPLNLDQVTVVTKAISALLDEAAFLDETAFTLEVSSPGVERPLTLPRHWRKNHDRLIKIVLTNGEVVEGRIAASDEVSVTVTGAKTEAQVAFADIKRATVEIEFNRKADQ
jgi:ribosome maturation factor RimP